jgi:hypothetical protein
MDEVQRFLNEKHPNNYKVYNLCSERAYPASKFHLTARYPFDDHNPPPLHYIPYVTRTLPDAWCIFLTDIDILRPFCEDLDSFYASHPNGVAVVHCKAGKSRTGTMIVCYLLYKGLFDNVDEAVTFFGNTRTDDGNGVNIPSQMRYIHYWFRYLQLFRGFSLSQPVDNKAILARITADESVRYTLNKVRIFTVPEIGGNHSEMLVRLYDGSKVPRAHLWTSSIVAKKKGAYMSDFVPFKYAQAIVLSGDVRLELVDSKADEILAYAWFNTALTPDDLTFTFHLMEIDKACKEKNRKMFRSDFKISVLLQKHQDSSPSPSAAETNMHGMPSTRSPPPPVRPAPLNLGNGALSKSDMSMSQVAEVLEQRLSARPTSSQLQALKILPDVPPRVGQGFAVAEQLNEAIGNRPSQGMLEERHILPHHSAGEALAPLPIPPPRMTATAPTTPRQMVKVSQPGRFGSRPLPPTPDASLSATTTTPPL